MRNLLLIATVAGFVAVAGSDASAQLTPDQVRCQDAASRLARVSADKALKARLGCVRRIAHGLLDPSVDCGADPEEIGGPGTGDLNTDRKLARLHATAQRAGKKLRGRCEVLDDLGAPDPAAGDIRPSDIGLDDTCSPASDEWDVVGACVVDLGIASAASVIEVMDLQTSGQRLAAGPLECIKEISRQVRQAVQHLSLWRARCLRDDAGNNSFDCGATVMPPGIVEATTHPGADDRLDKPYPTFRELALAKCDKPIDTLGLSGSTPDYTGGRFDGRITLDDVLSALNDRIQQAVYHVTYGDGTVGGIYDAPTAGYCGDGATDAGEECDDGNNISCDGCDRDCTLPVCGNGSACDPDECDDGNNISGDGCTSTCQSELCPNGITNPGYDEVCDDFGFSTACDDDCTVAFCGDGLANPVRGEICDEGSGTPTNTATCDSDCTQPFCPDGLVNTLNTTFGTVTGVGEECDDGGESVACDDNCTDATCGDGDLNTTRGEECDDNNASNNDSCVSADDQAGANCQDATCGDGFVCSDAGTCTTGPTGGIEACDGGKDVPLGDAESLTCNTNCSIASCGDGVVNGTAGEQCDDNNALDTDVCVSSDVSPETACKDAVCGDGFTCSDGACTTGPGGGVEECDDGDAIDTDTCLNNCAVATCGDGSVCSDAACTSGPGFGVEECDGGGAATALCDPDCSVAACGDGTLNTAAGETCDTAGESATCDSDCTAPSCGDGLANPSAGEECDDAGADGNIDTCLNNCKVATCGDAFVCSDPACDTAGNGPEECDDGAATPTCTQFCTNSSCGDGIINSAAGETCDAGAGAGPVETAACDSDCTAAFCGDGVINVTAGEQCDNAGANDSNTADACGDGTGPSLRGACQNPSCGDGVVDTGEACDDGAGNGTGEGFCVSDCSRVQTCGDNIEDGPGGTGLGTESCDDGEAEQCGTCNATCTGAGIGAAVCGDGFTCSALGEACDDGDTEECGTCDSTCSGAGIGAAVCGDSVICGGAYGETCDDGYADACGTCNATCDGAGAGETCGDGVICPETETCDDGVIPTDNCGPCNATCTGVGTGGDVCGDGTLCVEAGEECDDGGTTNGDTCSSICLDERYVFQTSLTYQPGVDFSGLAAADALCAARATAAGLPGTYMSWLSDSTGSPSTRFAGTATGASGPFIRTDGQRIANDWADFTDGSLLVTIDLDESGGVPAGGTSNCSVSSGEDGVWSNTLAAGTASDPSPGPGNDHCNNWSDSGGAGYDANEGDGGSTASSWTTSCQSSDISGFACQTAENLYCVQQ